MRPCPIPPLTSWVLLLALAMAGPPARAGIQYISTDDDNTITRTYGGSPGHLPVRPNLTWQEAVAWAHTMPGVQLAMETCAGRGYQAIAAHDTALISIDPPATIVMLPYRKPGLTLPEHLYGEPMIMIVTKLDRESIPTTGISAGLLILDPVQNAVFTADSLPSMAVPDGSFDISSDGGGEGVIGDKRWGVRWAWETKEAKPKFYKFARCLGLGSLGCMRTLFNITRTPGYLLISAADPELVGLYFSACELIVTGACAYDFYFD